MVVRLFSPLITFALTLGAIPVAKRVAWHFGWVAKPASDRWHKAPVALLGGVVVVVVFALVGWICGAPTWLVLGAVALCGVGLLDDIVNLAPRTKLLAQIPFAVTAAALVSVPPFLPWWLQYPLAAFWVLTAINAFNLIDGLDGLAAGLGGLAALSIAIIGIVHQDRGLVLIALLFCGALAGFLIYNFSPASIYLGDGGSLPCGFILAILCLDAASHPGAPKLSIVAIPALLMAVPIIDTSIVTVTRLATGRAISNRGLDHCHHRLHNLGISHRTVAIILWMLGALGGLCAVLLAVAAGPVTTSILPLCALMFATIGMFLANLSFEHEIPGRLYTTMPRLSRLILSLAYRQRAVEFALDFLVISSAYYGALLIHHNFQPSWPIVTYYSRWLPMISAAAYTAFVIARIYRQMWRYTGIEAALQFLLAAGLAGMLAAAMLSLGGQHVPASMPILFAILLFNLLLGTRMSFRILRAWFARFAAPARKVVVVGAGSIAESAARELLRDGRLKLVGFLDNDFFKHRMLVRGHLVLGGISDIDRVYEETGFEEILVAQKDLAEEDLTALQSFAIDHNIALHRYTTHINSIPVIRFQRALVSYPVSPSPVFSVAAPNGKDGNQALANFDYEGLDLQKSD